MAREMMDEGGFIEIFVDTPLEGCARRDPKGLYEKAFAGKIANFTGVSSPYEVPENPDLHLKTVGTGPAGPATDLRAAVVDVNGRCAGVEGDTRKHFGKWHRYASNRLSRNSTILQGRPFPPLRRT